MSAISLPRDQKIAPGGTLAPEWQRQFDLLFSLNERLRKAAAAATAVDPTTGTLADVIAEYNALIAALKE